MATRELGTLEQVPVREIWPHEENEFTPWLADNLFRLEQLLDLKLELLQVEAELPDAGRVDILAKDVTSGATVVIENQLEYSDDDHFARLMGYAASRDAGILIWVTTGFWDWHRDILDWLHTSYGIEVYGVEVSAWRIGDAVAHYFELIAGAPVSEGPAPASQSDDGEPAIGHRAYGRYYRPLTANLNSEGIHAMGGRWGGWTGSFRSFRTGYEEDGIRYALQIGDQDGKSWIWLLIRNDDHQTIYNALSGHRSEIAQEIVGHTLQWETSEEEGFSWVGMSTDATIGDAEEKLEATRSWMFDGLTKLRMAVQPRLDEVMA
jgi:hypothetical protein